MATGTKKKAEDLVFHAIYWVNVNFSGETKATTSGPFESLENAEEFAVAFLRALPTKPVLSIEIETVEWGKAAKS